MHRGASGANISNYGSYINNCNNQWPYKIPVNSLADVQLYASFQTEPVTILYELIHTCGPNAGVVETLATTTYVVGQDIEDNWYGVFRNFTGATDLNCFVIAITVDGAIYFSEEYCKETCKTLTLLKGCYGNLDNKISYDCQGIYFGTAQGAGAVGDPLIVYKHQAYIRDAEVYKSAIKNTFKQGRTRNFRTEKEKISQFNAEFIPEWYLDEIDAIFNRGEVYVGSTKHLLNETAFELIDEILKTWKMAATFKSSCYTSFSCELDPCADPTPEVPECCDPQGVSATVEIINLV